MRRALRQRRLRRNGERVPGLLEFLDAVPWDDYTHAYGQASDVPEHVLGLLDDETRAEAFDELWGSVWHQGTVYSASAPAATALALVAAADGVPERDQVIGLLASIATGNGYVQVHRAYLRDTGEDLDAIEAREARQVAAARQAVIDALAPLRTRLAGGEGDVAVRRALPYLFAVCGDQAARPVLRDRLEHEGDAAARASAVLALGALGDSELPDGPEPVVRLAAAVAAADPVRVMGALDGLEAFEALGAWTEGEAVSFVLAPLVPNDRVAVIATLAAVPDPDTRELALYAATELAGAWRSPTPRIVALLTERLQDDEDREAAVRGLYELAPASAPAADALLAIGSDTALRALARLGDRRLIPLLADALARDDPPAWTREALKAFGALAATVRDRVIALLPGLPDAGVRAGGIDNRLTQYTSWLGSLGSDGAPAARAIAEVLRSGKATHAALLALRALGPHAASARPELEQVLDDGDELFRALAAGAIAHATGDRGPLAAVMDELLVNPQRGALPQALDALEDFDVKRLEPLLEHDDEWVRWPAAHAIWRITHDHRRVAGALCALAQPRPTGAHALALLTELPPEASAPLRDQLVQWRDADHRQVVSGAADEVVAGDERLRELCVQLLGRF